MTQIKTKIEFYILNHAAKQQALFFAANLVEKAYYEKKRIYVHTNSSEESSRFDDFLWTFKEDSFLPHCIFQENVQSPPPIQIGHQANFHLNYDLIINFANEIPIFYKNFNHVIEIVFSDPTVQQLARDRYRQYREQQADLHTYKLNANEYDHRKNL